MIYGVDVSAYQPGFDFAAARRDGMDFAIIKATEGTGWRSSYYRDQVARARAAGLLVAAYHYVRGNDVAGQLTNIRAMVTPGTPVILDVEDGAGSLQSIRDLNAAVQRAGYRTPLIYIPRWYWQGHMGSPSLAGLPPLWHSRYPDNVVRRVAGFNLNDPAYWPSFGGLSTVIAQFTSSLAVANYPNGSIDGNAYRGTRSDLAALLNGTQKEDGMSWDTKLKNPEGFEDTAGNFLTYMNVAVNQQGAKLDELLEKLIGEGDRPLIQQHVDFIVNSLGAQITGLTAAVTQLAALVGQQDGADADELEAAVTRAIQNNIVRVDVQVGRDSEESA